MQRLEEQLFDLNAMVATLQSLVNQGTVAAPDAGGAPPMVPPQVTVPGPGVASGDVEQRINVIETQISALSGQMEQITNQLTQIQAALNGGQLPQQQLTPQLQPAPQPEPQTQGQPQPQAQTQRQSIFGTVKIEPEQQAAQPQQPAAQPGAIPFQQPLTAPIVPQQQAAAAPSADTRAVYDAAYNRLLQRDFNSAEAGFRDFLAKYPKDALAGNAQYWLGETYYVRGKFRQAADSFLTGYQKYNASDKAPANLLKLGMALHQLGEKDAACATFEELSSKFPRAPAHLKQRATSERQRSGC